MPYVVLSDGRELWFDSIRDAMLAESLAGSCESIVRVMPESRLETEVRLMDQNKREALERDTGEPWTDLEVRHHLHRFFGVEAVELGSHETWERLARPGVRG